MSWFKSDNVDNIVKDITKLQDRLVRFANNQYATEKDIENSIIGMTAKKDEIASERMRAERIVEKISSFIE